MESLFTVKIGARRRRKKLLKDHHIASDLLLEAPIRVSQSVSFTVVFKVWRYPATPKTGYKAHTPNDQLRFAFIPRGLGNRRQSL